MTLYDLKVGETGVISRVHGDEKLSKRLLALGCIRHTEVKVKLKAPLGDPILINFRGSDLAIRRKDAKNIFTRLRGKR